MHMYTINPIAVHDTFKSNFHFQNTRSVTDQSNPAAKLLSIAGDISLAALMMHLSAWDFLQIN